MFLITGAGLAQLAGLVSVCRDLVMFVKRHKNQLRDYMTTGPARLAEIPASRCRDPSFFHVIGFAGYRAESSHLGTPKQPG